MKRFIRDILLFVLPIAFSLCALEFGIRRIPNDYSYKSSWLSNNINEVKILSLGASNGYYGIQPRLFHVPAFNAAHVSQTPKYDHFIFKKYIDAADSLELIIYPISYCTLFFDMETGAEWWRTKNYMIYYKCHYYNKWNLKYCSEIFSNSDLYIQSKRVVKYVLKNETSINCDSLGFGVNYCRSNRGNDWYSNGFDRAKYHMFNFDKDMETLQKNKHYVKDIIEQCYKRNIKVLLLTTPVWSTYYNNINLNQLLLMTDFCDSLVAKYNNTDYLNLLKDNRFTEDDFFDADHFNEYGAAKLTMILSDYIKKHN